MQPEIVVLYCKECDWIPVNTDQVLVTLDLRRDKIIYETKCPICKGQINMSRRR